MLIALNIAFELRVPGPLIVLFLLKLVIFMKKKISKGSRPVIIYLLLKILQEEMHLSYPTSAKLLIIITFKPKMQTFNMFWI